MRYRTKHILEYAALRAVAVVVNILPYRAALLLGWLAAIPAFCIMRSRVREAERRIRSVFGDRFSTSEIRRIAWISFRNIAFNGIEILRFPHMTSSWINSVSDIEPGIARLVEHAKTGRGAVIAVPHMGSWDMAGIACHLHGLPIFSIAAQQHNPLVSRYLDRLRSSTGMNNVLRGLGTLKTILRNLAQGKMLAILPDVRMPAESIKVPFLGGEANLGAGMAMFARHADIPIFPYIMLRQGWSRHKLLKLDPVFCDKSLDKQEDIRRITAIVLRGMEEAIRANPEQWFWFNKRWVLDPL